MPFQGPKKSRIQGPPLQLALVMHISRQKSITSRSIKNTGALIVISHHVSLLESTPDGTLTLYLTFFVGLQCADVFAIFDRHPLLFRANNFSLQFMDNGL